MKQTQFSFPRKSKIKSPVCFLFIAVVTVCIFSRFTFGQNTVSADQKIEPSTPFYIASVSKTITGAVIDRLVERGLIKSQDSLGKYLDVGIYNKATIEQLLTHTSGILDFHQFVPYASVRKLSNEDAVELLRKIKNSILSPECSLDTAMPTTFCWLK